MYRQSGIFKEINREFISQPKKKDNIVFSGIVFFNKNLRAWQNKTAV